MNQRDILDERRERWLQRQSRERIEAGKKLLNEAKAAWKSLGEEKNGEKKQMRILSELIETRGKELRQAYENVVGVTYGYRTQKGRLKKIPSITFTVTEKHPDASPKLTEKNRIPDFLFTYGIIRSKHRLCAIPTDVEDMSVYKAVKPQSGSQYINVKSSGSNIAIEGTLTCAVTIRNPQGELSPKLYVMSCLHVLGMAQEFYPNFAPNPEVFLPCPSKEKRHIGRLSKHCGLILDKYLYSFDAALAEVADNAEAKEALNTVMPKPRPSKIIKNEKQIPETYDIWTPRRIISATRHHVWERTDYSIPYDDLLKSDDLTIWHRMIVESFANTEGGDSGSPVVSKDGETLLGMHIAGGGGRAFMIPAHILFEAERFYGLDGSTLRMTDNY